MTLSLSIPVSLQIHRNRLETARKLAGSLSGCWPGALVKDPRNVNGCVSFICPGLPGNARQGADGGKWPEPQGNWARHLVPIWVLMNVQGVHLSTFTGHLSSTRLMCWSNLTSLSGWTSCSWVSCWLDQSVSICLTCMSIQLMGQLNYYNHLSPAFSCP